MNIAFPGPNISHFVCMMACSLVLPGICLLENAQAHLELYHNVEANLTETPETGTVRLYFTIHAPELLVGFENAGADSFDAKWLRTRSDEEFNTLFERGRVFVKEKFTFQIDEAAPLNLTTLLRFEKPETIRDEKYQSGVPVGCLLVSAEITLDPGSKQLLVSLAEDAGKRLLLVCTRKGAFPETHDLDGGGSAALELPSIPAAAARKENPVTVASDSKAMSPWVLAVPALLFFVSILLIWRRRM